MLVTLSWLAACTILLAIYLTSVKNRWALLLQAIGSGLWAAVGLFTPGMVALAVMNIIVACTASWGLCKWLKES